jgi:thiol:disulfide interchange protein DsbC
MKPRIALTAVLAALVACGGDPRSETPAADAAAPAAPAPQAEPAAAPAEPVAAGDPRIALSAMMPGTRPEVLRATPVAGVYELAHDGEITYVSADGKYVFSGNLFQVTADGEFPNLTEQRRREVRLQLLAAVPEKEMIVFGPARAPHTITVFTDVDCQWCQHMHAQIREYNKLGIRVRYLAFPRSGPDSESAEKLEAVWCARDRGEALTTAKQGGRVESRKCSAPVARHYALGQKFGISGTPGVVLATGEVIPGYLPPEDMLQAIEESPAVPVSR